MAHINLTITDSAGTVITAGGDTADEEALTMARGIVDILSDKAVKDPTPPQEA